jgi:riboflavin synthase
MFTGIIRFIAEVTTVTPSPFGLNYSLIFPEIFHKDLKIGCSVSIDGVCQTLVGKKDHECFFDAIEETLKRTTLKNLFPGRCVNVEPSAKIGDEIGGHFLSGHIFGTARIHSIKKNIYEFYCPVEWIKYFFSKGFIAIDGASLTLVEVNGSSGIFSIHLIPETLLKTTLGFKKEGDPVNIELDFQTQVIVETLERLERKKQ